MGNHSDPFIITTGNPEGGNYSDYLEQMPIRKLFNPELVQERLKMLSSEHPALFIQAEAGATSEVRKANPLLDVICDALDWLRELQDDVATGVRDANGDLKQMC
ncbi:MAG: hypothetical protein V4681_03975 [Patescibacteria group bacterium]